MMLCLPLLVSTVVTVTHCLPQSKYLLIKTVNKGKDNYVEDYEDYQQQDTTLSHYSEESGVEKSPVIIETPFEDDYTDWSQDFDTNENCAQEEKINELKISKASQCVEVADNGGTPSIALKKCVIQLERRLGMMCQYTAIENAGNLHYCSHGETMVCCFDDYTCVPDEGKNQETYIEEASKYLKDPEDYMENVKTEMGYQTCHPLKSSMDATVCANDCKEMEKEKFATDCKKKGGLFKCCIRRDAYFCNECRFCCTLGICTLPTSSGSVSEFALQDNKTGQTGVQMYIRKDSIYKDHDYRCLKPFSHKKPERWQTYEMHQFREAANEKKLAKVNSFKYDKNFNNWIDMDVLKEYTKNTFGKAWKQSYGLENVRSLPRNPPTNQTKPEDKNSGIVNTDICGEDCIDMERSKFAKKCKKRGGFFKCCMRTLNLHGYEDTRNALIEKNLIKGRSTSMCGMNAKKERDPCMFCHIVGQCTERKKNGKLKHTFKGAYQNEYKVPGLSRQEPEDPWGIKHCHVINLCQEYWAQTYEITAFTNAANKKQLCNAKITRVNGVMGNITEHEISRHKCLNQKSDNVLLCPEKYLKKTKNQLLIDRNQKFKEILYFPRDEK